MNKYINSNISELPAADFFFDANILLYLHFEVNQKLSKDYSRLVKHIYQMHPKAKHYTNSIVISEVVNKMMTILAQKYKYTSNKAFRKSSVGRESLNKVLDRIEYPILNIYKTIDINVDKETIRKIIKDVDFDYNDKIIEEICSQHNLILITHDGDFKNSEVDIVTLNTKYHKN